MKSGRTVTGHRPPPTPLSLTPLPLYPFLFQTYFLAFVDVLGHCGEAGFEPGTKVLGDPIFILPIVRVHLLLVNVCNKWYCTVQ